jgi:HEPN domain-containing protein
MDINRQIKYWIDSGNDDISSAGILIEKNKYLHGLFFCHLAVEKILKAIYVKRKNDFAPKTHNLLYLCELCGIEPDDDNKVFFAVLMKYQISGRYPDSPDKIIEFSTADEYYNKTQEAVVWLTRELN